MLELAQAQTLVTTCPDCGRFIRLTGTVFVGMEETCPHCGMQLAVIEIAPVKRDWAYEEWDVNEDDW